MERGRVGDSGIAREIAIVLQAIDMTIPDGRGSYLAAPISTGRRYQHALATTGAQSFDQLLECLGEKEYLERVRWPNVEEGERIAERLRHAGERYLVNTGPLFIEGWSGKDYMELCFALISRKITRVYFHDEWAFSSGATQELLFCVERNIESVSANGEELSLDRARQDLLRAIAELDSLGVPSEGQLRRLRQLEEVMGVGQPALAASTG